MIHNVELSGLDLRNDLVRYTCVTRGKGKLFRGNLMCNILLHDVAQRCTALHAGLFLQIEDNYLAVWLGLQAFLSEQNEKKKC
jgi:hypothetical protein